MNENDREAQLTAEILDLFVSIVGFIPRDAVTAQTNFVREFDIIDDDLTCFMMQVKWRHKLKADQAVWESIETIEQLVDYVLTHGER